MEVENDQHYCARRKSERSLEIGQGKGRQKEAKNKRVNRQRTKRIKKTHGKPRKGSKK